jgi:hypothetical protein
MIRNVQGSIDEIEFPPECIQHGWFLNRYPVINDINEQSYKALKTENGRKFIEEFVEDADDVKDTSVKKIETAADKVTAEEFETSNANIQKAKSIKETNPEFVDLKEFISTHPDMISYPAAYMRLKNGNYPEFKYIRGKYYCKRDEIEKMYERDRKSTTYKIRGS